MARIKSGSIPFNEYIFNKSSNMSALVERIRSAIVKHLDLKRVSSDYTSHLNLYLSNLFTAHKDNINLGVPMGVAYWVNPRVGKSKNISYTTLKNIHDTLRELGYIKQQTKHAHYEDYKVTRTFKATTKLVRLFNSSKLNSQQLTVDLVNYPTIELRDFKPKQKYDSARKKAGKQQKKRPKGKLLDLVRYGNKQSERYADQVRSINYMYKSHHINLFVTDTEETTVRKQMSAKDDEEFKTLQFHRWYVRRVFNNKSWEQGGRFYGGWWTSVPSMWRERITIDNYITQEIDYSAIHFNMLYQDLKAIVPKGMCGAGKFDSSGLFDPYDLQNYNQQWKGKDIFENRKITKLAMNVMLNSETKDIALNVLRKDKNKFPNIPTGFKTWKDFADHITDKHQPIAHKFYSGEGLKYQFRDSEVALNVITRMASKHGTAVLPIHDSFLVVRHKADQLYQEMKEAIQEAGYTMAMTLDQEPQTTNIMEIDWKECTKYRQRLENYHQTLPVRIKDYLQPPLLEHQVREPEKKEE